MRSRTARSRAPAPSCLLSIERTCYRRKIMPLFCHSRGCGNPIRNECRIKPGVSQISGGERKATDQLRFRDSCHHSIPSKSLRLAKRRRCHHGVYDPKMHPRGRRYPGGDDPRFLPGCGRALRPDRTELPPSPVQLHGRLGREGHGSRGHLLCSRERGARGGKRWPSNG